MHGSSMSAAQNFGHLVAEFADRRTVVTPDYSGSGETAEPNVPLTLDILVGQVITVAEVATTGPVDMLGFSLGAVVAAAVAARRPELIRRLVLVAGWPSSNDPRLRLGLRAWADSLAAGPDLASAVAPLLAFSPAFLSSLGPNGLAELRSAPPEPGTPGQIAVDLEIDLRAELPRITAPTLVIGCAQDNLIPVRHARDLHAAIPASRYTEIDSGHVIFFEKPVELVSAVQEFLYADDQSRPPAVTETATAAVSPAPTARLGSPDR
ncbi:alpha/beta fold hydrolase [Nocardia blacklockiae]|uniref:alpha/beta fold hydrolase n=1 Tax=Nocardia blacklockiae TaxID=480036 RepID=UPI002B4B5984|nr:alpha/beta hydrolase [Nocardia blacklockiae]